MKRIPLLLALALCASATVQAVNTRSFKGTALRMQMTECIVSTGFKVAMSGRPTSVGSCPEYTVISPTVVYVVVGRRTEDFVPLEEEVEFVLRKNELLSNAGSKSRFVIHRMTLRGDWEREEERKELAAEALERSVSRERRNPPRDAMFTAAK
jgi:hypothetical protein